MGNNLFGIGFGELVFIAILVLIIVGPKRLPEVARTIGRFLQQVRQATGGVEEEMRRLVAGEGDPASWLEGTARPGPLVSEGGEDSAPAPHAGPAPLPGPDVSSPSSGDKVLAQDDGPAAIPPSLAG